MIIEFNLRVGSFYDSKPLVNRYSLIDNFIGFGGSVMAHLADFAYFLIKVTPIDFLEIILRQLAIQLI